MNRAFLSCAVAGMAAAAQGADSAAPPAASAPPAGWALAGLYTKDYVAGVDTTACYQGHPCAYLKSENPVSASSYSGLVQTFDADRFRGKRVRFSGFLRTEAVTGRAGLYLRIDGPDREWKNALAVDLMDDRPVKATTPWTHYETVLDVGPTASQITLGTLLHGTGKVWLAAFRFEEVDTTVSTTGRPRPLMPTNLDFEK
jgi:hypothetical protein